MQEYDVVCDTCGRTVTPDEGIVSWTTEGARERDHAITHASCAPAAATDRLELRLLISPSGFLGFVTDRFAHQIARPEVLASIVWALAPFSARPDTGVEMNVLRAATFGTVFGLKPGEIRRRRVPGHDLGTAG